MDIAKLKNAIVDLATKNPGGVSYAELMTIPGFAGEFNLVHPQFPLVLFWKGLSHDAAACVRELLDAGLVQHAPTDSLAYLAHGQTLDLPILTPELVRHAAELSAAHWMPVLIVCIPKAHSAPGSV
jgi:hypothetical protein